jgi:hypothetical protein
LISHAYFDAVSGPVESRVSDERDKRSDEDRDDETELQSAPSLKKLPIFRNLS